MQSIVEIEGNGSGDKMVANRVIGSWEWGFLPAANVTAKVVRTGLKSLAMERGDDLGDHLAGGGLPAQKIAPKGGSGGQIWSRKRCHRDRLQQHRCW